MCACMRKHTGAVSVEKLILSLSWVTEGKLPEDKIAVLHKARK